MAEIYVTKHLSGGLYPANQQAADYMKGIKANETLRAMISKPRNYEFHKKFFALLQLVYDNTGCEKYDNFEAFRAEVTMRAGKFTEHVHLSGAISFVPKSISFASMDQVEFEGLYSKAVNVILKHFLPKTNPEKLEQEVLNFASRWAA